MLFIDELLGTGVAGTRVAVSKFSGERPSRVGRVPINRQGLEVYAVELYMAEWFLGSSLKTGNFGSGKIERSSAAVVSLHLFKDMLLFIMVHLPLQPPKRSTANPLESTP